MTARVNPESGRHPSQQACLTLETACTNREIARILVDKSFIDAVFSRVSEEGVRLELLTPSAISLTPLSVCFITFPLGGRSCAFVGRVKQSEVSYLILETPDVISIVDGRRSFRVPISRRSGLRVQVAIQQDGEGGGKGSLSARGVDISLTGILIEFGAQIPEGVRVGTKVSVALELHGSNANLSGIVRRLKPPSEVGIFFPDTVRKGEVFAPPDLRSLVGHLERQWIQEKPD